MKACRIAGLIVVLVLAAVISSNGQQGVEVPNLINYQGRLLNGTNLYNGIVPITFRLYTVPSGPDMPVCVDSNNVEVVDGFYSTYIGDNVTWGSLDNALNNTQVWVEVVIGTNVMAPRELMASEIGRAHV